MPKNETKAPAPKGLAITPVMTEKAYAAESSRIYIFQVPRQASKAAIAQVIADEFKVTITSIRTLRRKGKPTRFSRGKHAYPGLTYRQDKKFAYITLKEGDRIPVFDEVKDEAKPEKTEKADKADKKAAKATEKTAKTAKGDK